MLIRGLYIIVAIAIVVLLYLITVWSLAFLGVPVPDKILKVIFFIVALLAIIGALTGRYDNIWRSGP